MYKPYEICVICYQCADEKHHEPPKTLLHGDDYNPKKGIDNPKYHKWMCRGHHNEREQLGYESFKKKYPRYEGISILEIGRASCRERV